MLISNDPTQYPYRGKFAAQRALDKYGYLNRDLAYGTILMKFSEQGHVGRPDFKSYQAIHDIDVTRCDSISYNIVRLLKEEFPTFNSDVAQSLRQQYEGADGALRADAQVHIGGPAPNRNRGSVQGRR